MKGAWPRRSAMLAGGALLLLSPAAADAVEPAADRPLRIIKPDDFRFPMRMLAGGVVTGEVQVILSIDRRGTLEDHLFVAYTHYEFANEVSRTVARWTFEPAVVNGRAIASTVEMNVRFEVNGVVVRQRRGLEEPPRARGSYMFRARELGELDNVPALLFSVPPRNPAAVDEPAVTGRVQVSFYIDEQGRVRMPVVSATDDPRLGWAALAAIRRWRYEVPTHGGHPVLARASLDFVFQPET